MRMASAGRARVHRGVRDGVCRFARVASRGTLFIVVVLLLGACASDRPEELVLPEHSSLRAQSGMLMDRVEEIDEPPKWVNEKRVQGDEVYALGVVEAKRMPEHDLHRAMVAARESAEAWLADHGGLVESPNGLVDPLEPELHGIRYEKLAHDRRQDMWYALAKIDLEAEARVARANWERLNDELARHEGVLEDDESAWEDRVSAALAMVFALERRAQYAERYAGFEGEALEEPEDLETDDLEDEARDVLQQHSIRLVLDTPPIDGLGQRVDAIFAAVHVPVHDFGEGLVSIRLRERNLFAAQAGTPYLYLEGNVQTAIAGGDTRVRTVPVQAVETAASEDEARSRAEIEASNKVERVIWDALGRYGIQ